MDEISQHGPEKRVKEKRERKKSEIERQRSSSDVHTRLELFKDVGRELGFQSGEDTLVNCD